MSKPPTPVRFDPDELLSRIRRHVDALNPVHDVDSPLRPLLDSLADLDAHLSTGGDLPADWTTPDPMQRDIFGPADGEHDWAITSDGSAHCSRCRALIPAGQLGRDVRVRLACGGRYVADPDVAAMIYPGERR